MFDYDHPITPDVYKNRYIIYSEYFLILNPIKEKLKFCILLQKVQCGAVFYITSQFVNDVCIMVVFIVIFILYLSMKLLKSILSSDNNLMCNIDDDVVKTL